MLEEGWFSLTGRHIRDAYEVLTPRSRKGINSEFYHLLRLRLIHIMVPPLLYEWVLSSQKKRKKIEESGTSSLQ